MTRAGEPWLLDHAAMTVPDLDEAVAFFGEVVGARVLYRRQVPPRSEPGQMADRYGAHPDAGFRLVKLDVAGAPVELFEYEAPDQRRDAPRNCDVGGHHLGFAVTDMNEAVGRLRAYPGVRILGDVSELPEGHPLAGRKWIYFLTPWDQQLELVSDEQRDLTGFG